MAYDSSKPVTSGALVAADIRENFRALKDDVIVNAANADNADKVDGFHASQTPGANLCAVADANGKLPVGWLKFAEGSWTVTISGGGYASVQLVAHSHWPQTSSNNVDTIVNFGGSVGVALPTTYSYQFWVANINEYNNPANWLGIYDYHAASEQILEVYYDIKGGKIIGIHVTEKGNENSVKFYDPKLKEIISHKKVFTKIDIPEFFEENICKYRAEILFGDEKKKKLIKQKITKLVKVQKNAS